MVEGTSNEEKRRTVLAKLAQPCDLYVLANFPVAKLPGDIQFEVLRRVKEGAGLLLCYRREALEPMWRHPLPEASRVIEEVPLAGLTFYRGPFLAATRAKTLREAAPSLVTGYRLGQGRIALLDYGIQSPAAFAGGFCLTPHEPFTYRTLTEYDYHQSLVAKAALWAARREPPVRFAGLPLDGFRFSSDAPQRRLEATVSSTATGPLVGSLEVSVRNEWGEAEHAQKLPLTVKPGSQPLALTLPALPGGTHFLDLRLSTPGGIAGWASAAVLVSSPVSIAKAEMAALSFERNQPCVGTAVFSKPCDGAGWTGFAPPAPAVKTRSQWTLRVDLLDNYGRRFCRRDFPLPAGAAAQAFSLPLDACVSLAGRARLLLLRGQQPVDQVESEFFVLQRNEDYFPALVWGNLPSFTAPGSTPSCTTTARVSARDAGLRTLRARTCTPSRTWPTSEVRGRGTSPTCLRVRASPRGSARTRRPLSPTTRWCTRWATRTPSHRSPTWARRASAPSALSFSPATPMSLL
jgi:hypothetical protein